MTPAQQSAGLVERLLDRLLGPRDWSVVDDRGSYPCVYAVPTSRVDRGDILLATGLRYRAARREAAELLPYYDEPVFRATTPTADERGKNV